MGSPEFSVLPLEKLIKDDEIEVSLVVSQPDRRRNRNKYTPTPVKALAVENNIDVITPENVNKEGVLEKIKSYDPDFIVVIAYGQIIKEGLLLQFDDRIINIHASLLPKYRGAAPINWAIINGEEKTGVCSMLVEKGLDSGDVLDSLETEIKYEDDAISLEKRLSILASDLIVSTLKNYDSLYKKRIKQGDDFTLAPKLNKEMGHIDWEKNASDIRNLVRGLKDWPATYSYFGDEKVKIHEVKELKVNSNVKPGTILCKKDKLVIKCGDNAIEILELQFPNKKKMDTKSYLLGNEIKVERVK